MLPEPRSGVLGQISRGNPKRSEDVTVLVIAREGERPYGFKNQACVL